MGDREFGTPSTPEPLSYHQPGHPDVAEPSNHRAWRRPLLSEDECDHGRTFTDTMDGLGGESVYRQCLDCATVLETDDASDES